MVNDGGRGASPHFFGNAGSKKKRSTDSDGPPSLTDTVRQKNVFLV